MARIASCPRASPKLSSSSKTSPAPAWNSRPVSTRSQGDEHEGRHDPAEFGAGWGECRDREDARVAGADDGRADRLFPLRGPPAGRLRFGPGSSSQGALGPRPGGPRGLTAQNRIKTPTGPRTPPGRLRDRPVAGRLASQGALAGPQDRYYPAFWRLTGKNGPPITRATKVRTTQAMRNIIVLVIEVRTLAG